MGNIIPWGGGCLSETVFATASCVFLVKVTGGHLYSLFELWL